MLAVGATEFGVICDESFCILNKRALALALAHTCTWLCAHTNTHI